MLSKNEVKTLRLEDLKKVHIIGIVSGFHAFVATHLLNMGIDVKASEATQDNDIAKLWIERGVLYKGGHDANYITNELDLVIVPNGVIPGNPECEQAELLDIPMITLPEILGLITRNYKTIAVAGTHGKTTTSAVMVWMLYKEYGELPNFVIGDEILDINKTYHINNHSEYLVIESCEYKRQFLDRVPNPYISVITNVELDHLDYFKNQEDYNDAFREFISNTRYKAVIDSRKENVMDVLGDTDYIDCKDIEGMYEGITAGLHGAFNHENVMRVCATANILGIFPDIEDFPGVASRFQYIGRTKEGNDVYLDYAHNPQKIQNCLKDAKEIYADRKIVFVWQPHSLKRSVSFKKEFAESLDDADVVLLPNIFLPLREAEIYIKDENKKKMTDKEFVEFLRKESGKDVRYTGNFENTVEELKQFGKEYVFVFASAGDLKDIFKLMDIENE